MHKSFQVEKICAQVLDYPKVITGVGGDWARDHVASRMSAVATRFDGRGGSQSGVVALCALVVVVDNVEDYNNASDARSRSCRPKKSGTVVDGC